MLLLLDVGLLISRAEKLCPTVKAKSVRLVPVSPFEFRNQYKPLFRRNILCLWYP